MLLPFGHLPNLPVRLGVLSGDPGLKKEHKNLHFSAMNIFLRGLASESFLFQLQLHTPLWLSISKTNSRNIKKNRGKKSDEGLHY